MTSDTITLALEGEVYLDDFAEAITGLRRLVSELAKELLNDAKIEWSIDALERSSAIATIRGHSEAPEAVEQVTNAYLAAGRAEEQGLPLPYSQPVRNALKAITHVLNGRVRAIRFETAEGEATLQSAEAKASGPPLIGAYGAASGRIQTLSNRDGLRFTLYDLVHDRAISCYLAPGQQETMRGLWGSIATVEGWVSRDRTTGRAVSVRRVTKVVPKQEVEPGSYRLALGAVPKPTEAEPPEVIIRRLRDA